MKRLFSFIFLLCLSIFVEAQNCPTALPSTAWVRGNFTAPALACAAQPINVGNVGTTTNIRYIYDYKTLSDTSKGVAASNFTYSQAGIYLVVQTGIIGGRRSFACNRVQVVNNPKPTFTATTCSNATVRINISTAGLPYQGYLINWGDGSAAQTYIAGQAAPTHTYTQNRAYNVIVTGSYVGVTCNGISDAVSVTPAGVPPVLPVFSKVEVIDDRTVELTYTGGVSGAKYELRQRILPLPITSIVPNATTTIVGNDTKLRITGLSTQTNIYCFALSLTTTCGTNPVSISTSEVCTMALQNVLTPNYQNNLVWRPLMGVPQPKQFVIYRDGVQLAIVAANVFQYPDTKAVCGKKYSYQVVAEFTGSPLYNSVSSMKEASTQPVVPPPSLTEVLANVKNDQTALIYVVTTPPNTRIKSYLLERGDGITESSTKTVFTDSLANPGSRSVCYKLSYTDACDRTTEPTKTVCTIFLQAKGETLRWTPELPFLSKNSMYTVERLDAQGRIRKNYTVSAGTNNWDMDPLDTDQEVYYRIRATSTTRIAGTSNIVSFFRTMKIYAPSAFTPNGDANNETFEIKGLFIKSATVNIYSRNGHLVFQTEDWKKSWNGLFLNGSPAESGSYAYTIQAIDFKGNAASVTGTVEVLR